jgi:hypothetical protein
MGVDLVLSFGERDLKNLKVKQSEDCFGPNEDNQMNNLGYITRNLAVSKGIYCL